MLTDYLLIQLIWLPHITIAGLLAYYDVISPELEANCQLSNV